MILGNFFPGQRKAAQSTGIIYTPDTKQTHSRAQTRTCGTTPPSASSFHANSDPLSLEGRNAFSWKPGHGKDGSWLSQEGVLRKLLQTDGDPGGALLTLLPQNQHTSLDVSSAGMATPCAAAFVPLGTGFVPGTQLLTWKRVSRTFTSQCCHRMKTLKLRCA